MKKQLKHCNFRLHAEEHRLLAEMAAERGTTISETCRELLFGIVHQLQTERFQERALLMGNAHSTATRTTRRLDVKLPRDICDYLQFNGYTMTTTLIYALTHGHNKDNDCRQAAAT